MAIEITTPAPIGTGEYGAPFSGGNTFAALARFRWLPDTGNNSADGRLFAIGDSLVEAKFGATGQINVVLVSADGAASLNAIPIPLDTPKWLWFIYDGSAASVYLDTTQAATAALTGALKTTGNGFGFSVGGQYGTLGGGDLKYQVEAYYVWKDFVPSSGQRSAIAAGATAPADLAPSNQLWGLTLLGTAGQAVAGGDAGVTAIGSAKDAHPATFLNASRAVYRASIAPSTPTPATTYTLTGPTTGTAGQPGTYTVTAGTGTITGTVVVTPTPVSGVTFSGAVSLTDSVRSGTFTATKAAAGTYNVATTDNGGLTDPSPIAVTISAAPAPSANTFRPLGIGDSIMAPSSASGPFRRMLGLLPPILPDWTIDPLGSNQAHAGSATIDWQPGGAYLTAALQAGDTLNESHWLVMLGDNDAIASVPKATYKTRLAAIVAAGTARGKKVILCAPTYFTAANGRTTQQQALLLDYAAAIRELVNGTTVLLGDDDAHDYFKDHPSELSDGLHPGDPQGSISLAAKWAAGVISALTNPVGAPSGDAPVTDADRTSIANAVLAALGTSGVKLDGTQVWAKPPVGGGAITTANILGGLHGEVFGGAERDDEDKTVTKTNADGTTLAAFDLDRIADPRTRTPQ